jgi:flagellar biosynthesis protein FlhG
MRVIGITSGKGGVGKTTVAVNLAVELASRGNKVLLLDGDLGLSNAQILLNARIEFSYGHVLTGQKTLKDVLVESEYGVTLVPGSSGSSALAQLTRLQLLGLIHALSTLGEYDYLVVDTAAGIGDNVTVLFGSCDVKLLLIQNEPSSIADAYATVKVLQQEFNITDVTLTPVQVANQIEAQNIHKRIDGVTSQFLDLSIGYSCGVRKDQAVLNAARLGQPVVLNAPQSDVALDIRRLADFINASDNFDGGNNGLNISLPKGQR